MKQLEVLSTLERDLVSGGECSGCPFPNDCICKRYNDGKDSITTGITLIALGGTAIAIPLLSLVIYAIRSGCNKMGYIQV